MKKLFIPLYILFISISAFTQDNPVYFGMALGSEGEKGIIIEDHYTFKKNIEFWGKSAYGMNYDSYANYMKDIIKKYGIYNDTLQEYFFDDYKPEFSKLTDIKPGERFYVSSGEGVYLSGVYKYYIQLDDEIGGGNIFYAVVKRPEAEKEKGVVFQEGELVICSKSGAMSKIYRTGVTDTSSVSKFKKILLPLLKKVQVGEFKDGKEVWRKMNSIDDADLKLFKAPLTNTTDEKGNLINLYLVSFCKQVSFHDFASAIYIMDEKGKLLKEFSDLRKKDFNYMKVTGIVDVNGDGVYEIITEDGYYEGRGSGLWLYTPGEFKFISNGFNFGV